jgi:arylsulfatase A-like enzyme
VTKAGSISNEPIVSMDFFPTMLELAGLPPKPNLHADGLSIVPVLKGKKGKTRPLYWHYPHYHGSTWTPGASIRDGDWKLIKFYDYEKVELYNLKSDPFESKDLSKQNPDKTQKLENKLIAWQNRLNAKLPRPNPDYKK